MSRYSFNRSIYPSPLTLTQIGLPLTPLITLITASVYGENTFK